MKEWMEKMRQLADQYTQIHNWHSGAFFKNVFYGILSPFLIIYTGLFFLFAFTRLQILTGDKAKVFWKYVIFVTFKL